MSNTKFDKILAIICGLSFLVVATTINITGPANHYELTIYHAYPIYFWFAVATIMVCSLGIVIHSSFSKVKTKWWIVGLLFELLVNAITLSLPYFRGYAFFPNGDAMTHVGLMKDIISTGHVTESNFYPIVHILGVNLVYMTGLKYEAIVTILFVSWTTIYVLGMTILARLVSKTSGQSLLIVAFSCPLAFSSMHVLIHPSMLSLFTVPIFLYLYHRLELILVGRQATTAMLLIVAVFITFAHPITCLLVILFLIAINISRTTFQKFSGNTSPAKQTVWLNTEGYKLPVVMIIIFCLWYLSYAGIQGSILRVWDFLAHGSGMSLFEQELTTLSTADLSIINTITLFIYRFGAIFIYATIAVISLGIVAFKWLRNREIYEPIDFTYSILFIVAVGASMFSLFGFTGEYSSARIARFFLVITPVLVGAVLYKITGSFNRQTTHRFFEQARTPTLVMIVISIFSVAILSMLNIYGSPRIYDSNWQITQRQLMGAQWFSINENRQLITNQTIGIDLYRCDDLNFGIASTNVGHTAKLNTLITPFNLGYDGESSIANIFTQQTYLLTSEVARTNFALIPPNELGNVAGYYDQSTNTKLQTDPAVSKIYCNPGFEIWLVEGKTA